MPPLLLSWLLRLRLRSNHADELRDVVLEFDALEKAVVFAQHIGGGFDLGALAFA